MLRFQVCVHGENVGPLSVTFEQAFAALERLERLFIEPDGSFVWTGSSADGQPWQVDGNLIDRGDTLAYVELKGQCPSEPFDRLLAALGWPETKVAFQLSQRGVFVDETELRRLAATDEGAI